MLSWNCLEPSVSPRDRRGRTRASSGADPGRQILLTMFRDVLRSAKYFFDSLNIFEMGNPCIK